MTGAAAKFPDKFPWGGAPPHGAELNPARLRLPLILGGRRWRSSWPEARYTLFSRAHWRSPAHSTASTRPSSPITQGVHLKLPFVTVVDRMQVSTDSSTPPADLRVLSHDGHVIQLGVSLTRHIPADAVYTLLYNTGGVGNVDIDRTLTIFGREDVLNIASERERDHGAALLLLKLSCSLALGRLV